MTKEKYVKFVNDHKKEIILTFGVFEMVCGVGIGFALHSMRMKKTFVNAKWNFEIIDNAKLVVRMRSENSKNIFKWTFTGRSTKEIVDHLFDELYPGD